MQLAPCERGSNSRLRRGLFHGQRRQAWGQQSLCRKRQADFPTLHPGRRSRTHTVTFESSTGAPVCVALDLLHRSAGEDRRDRQDGQTATAGEGIIKNLTDRRSRSRKPPEEGHYNAARKVTPCAQLRLVRHGFSAKTPSLQAVLVVIRPAWYVIVGSVCPCTADRHRDHLHRTRFMLRRRCQRTARRAPGLSGDQLVEPGRHERAGGLAVRGAR